jgi:hypothetical protein
MAPGWDPNEPSVINAEMNEGASNPGMEMQRRGHLEKSGVNRTQLFASAMTAALNFLRLVAPTQGSVTAPIVGKSAAAKVT